MPKTKVVAAKEACHSNQTLSSSSQLALRKNHRCCWAARTGNQNRTLNIYGVQGALIISFFAPGSAQFPICNFHRLSLDNADEVCGEFWCHKSAICHPRESQHLRRPLSSQNSGTGDRGETETIFTEDAVLNEGTRTSDTPAKPGVGVGVGGDALNCSFYLLQGDQYFSASLKSPSPAGNGNRRALEPGLRK